jgi:hypothetical protein
MLSRATWIQATSSCPKYSRLILIFCYHIHCPHGSFLSFFSSFFFLTLSSFPVFRLRLCIYFSPLPCVTCLVHIILFGPVVFGGGGNNDDYHHHNHHHVEVVRETTSLNCGHQQAYCSPLRWWAWRTMVMISTEERLSRPRELSGNYASNHLVAKQEEVANKMNLAYETYLWYFEVIFTFRKILLHGPRLYFPSEVRRAEDFYCPQPGLSPRTSGPMTSTLTTRPPRTTNIRRWLRRMKFLIM